MGAQPRAASIALSILALVIGSVVAATAIFFIITFNGPPPKDPPRSIDSIAHALQTGNQPGDPGPPLRITTRPHAPVPDDTLRRDRAAAARMAVILHTPADRVVALVRPQPRGMGSALVGKFTFAWRTGSAWRVVENSPIPLFTRWHWVTLTAMLAAILILALPAWLIARAISRPLRAIADHAVAARAGAPLGPMPQGGPREVRLLAGAVTHMHRRLARHAEGRTVMLAAIAHDLGTPLSRLAFWVEKLPDDARTRAAADLDEMRAMLGSVLRFACDEAAENADARIDLGSLLDSLVEDMTVSGATVSIEPGPRVIVRGDPHALRRLFANLLENAIRYGRAAIISWDTTDGRVSIAVDDHGPGFDPATADRLFEPFVRGDPSRNRGTGGTGLGLAIVRSIAETHGGSVVLDNQPTGGRVRISLPVAR
ncbi:conserved hypothetical protein [Sphingomonas sp. EC-HK361]|uniref:sensor histidine kinase n=1 Tax=Sphingomonas sp. EC-HK361 TaxID=2038397 RepID=UPI00125B8244|nr:ATP-binding protein [Sphingomonas sp. EC-HK361]VVT00250.1 conserved hypothetical protein [Sphingomonas sp. EC-HK361]